VRAATQLLLPAHCLRRLADRLAREVALGTWPVRLHSRTVVRPGYVLLGGEVTNTSRALGLWVPQRHFPCRFGLAPGHTDEARAGALLLPLPSSAPSAEPPSFVAAATDELRLGRSHVTCVRGGEHGVHGRLRARPRALPPHGAPATVSSIKRHAQGMGRRKRSARGDCRQQRTEHRTHPWHPALHRHSTQNAPGTQWHPAGTRWRALVACTGGVADLAVMLSPPVLCCPLGAVLWALSSAARVKIFTCARAVGNVRKRLLKFKFLEVRVHSKPVFSFSAF
jgi:hypothetical protein